MAWTDPSSINFNTGQVITETKLEQVTADLEALVRAGDATGLAPTTTAADITSSTSELSMRTAGAAGNTTGWLIPAGLIGTNRLVRLIAHGDSLYNSAGATLRMRVYLRDGAGANTLLFDKTSGATNTSGNRQPWELTLNVGALGSASSQIFWGVLHHIASDASAATSGIGHSIWSGGAAPVVFADDSASAVDMSAARYLDVTVTWSASSASLSWRLKYATLQVF